MNAARIAPKSETAANHWPAWTDRPIPFRLASPEHATVADAQHRSEVERHARQRGGLARLTDRDTD